MVVSYRDRAIDYTRPVEVYRNVRRQSYSIRQDSKVVAHTDKIVLKNATFIVKEAGRRKVLKTGVKNVHAWVLGHVNTENFGVDVPLTFARYNPKETKTFVNEHGERVTSASFVVISDRGVLYV